MPPLDGNIGYRIVILHLDIQTIVLFDSKLGSMCNLASWIQFILFKLKLLIVGYFQEGWRVLHKNTGIVCQPCLYFLLFILVLFLCRPLWVGLIVVNTAIWKYLVDREYWIGFCMVSLALNSVLVVIRRSLFKFWDWWLWLAIIDAAAAIGLVWVLHVLVGVFVFGVWTVIIVGSLHYTPLLILIWLHPLQVWLVLQVQVLVLFFFLLLIQAKRFDGWVGLYFLEHLMKPVHGLYMARVHSSHHLRVLYWFAHS